MKLRPYQSEILAKTRRALHHHKRVLMQLPTGGGKTVISSTMLGNAAQRGNRCWFIVHRKELVDQTSRTLQSVGVPHGFIAAGFRPIYNQLVTVCSVQTLRSRAKRLIEQYGPPQFIVWDEAHHCAAGTWQYVADLCPDAFHVGCTATPERLDGKGLDKMFNALVPGPAIRWLIDNGYLSDFRIWSHDVPDLSGVRNRGSDYDRGELGDLMSESKIVGDAVEHYMDIAPNSRAIAFCCSVEHAYTTKDAFVRAGIVTEELDGTADNRFRRDTINAFRRGDIRVLTSVDLFGEGFDLPELETAILLRPTQSLGLYMQQVGRCLRASDEKEYAIILDHAGNVAKHGLPDEEREWKLKGRKKKRGEGAQPQKICDNCFGANPVSATRCVYCAYAFETESREIEHEDGELVELDVVEIRKQRKSEVDQARTREELEAIAKRRGYHPRWVKHILRARGQHAVANMERRQTR
ncbi:MAG: DEAD/DEAH box helicase [Pseudomonadota bacterium]